MKNQKINFNELETIKKICSNKLLKSMRKKYFEVKKLLNINRHEFNLICKKLDIYVPNMGLKGGIRNFTQQMIEDLRNGKNIILPTQTSQKRKIYIDSGIKKDQCEECDLLPKWNGKKLTLEFHHIDGNKDNNRSNNMKILCPNCHSQTDTFRGKNLN